MNRSMSQSYKSIARRLFQAIGNAVSRTWKPILPVSVWVFITFPTVVQAQSEFCSFSANMQQMMNDYPELVQEIPSNEAIIQNMINENPQAIMNNSIYDIPVVFHVIHLGESVGQGSNISNAQLDQALQDLNDDFRDALGLGNDVEIGFCLAQRDPNGSYTTGINRVNGSGVSNYGSLGIQSGGNEVAVKALSVWPNKDYLNIWIVHNIASPTGAQGYAYFPGAPASIDGIVLEAGVTGTTGNSGIISHEAGHYFQLHHTFEGGDETTCPSTHLAKPRETGFAIRTRTSSFMAVAIPAV